MNSDLMWVACLGQEPEQDGEDAMTTDPTPETDRARWLALYVLCGSVLMIVLDATIVNVALPSIKADLHFGASSLAWVVNAYLLAFGGLLLLAGRLGDLIGRRRIFLIGLAVFTTASAVCGLAVSQAMLVLARFAQGAGGALTSAVVLGMIVTMFPEPREQAKAIGVFAFVASAGGAVGLLAGGVLTEAINWHWIFFVNVPVGVAVAVAAVRLVRTDAGLGIGAGADVPGALLVTTALMLGVYTIVKPAAEDGWLAAPTLGLGAVSVALLVSFVVRQAHARSPLMPLELFGSRNLIGANVIQLIGAAGMFGTFFLGTLYLQNVKHYDAMQIGLAFLPVTLCMGILSVKYSEKLIMRFGPRTVSLAGLVLMAVGLGLFALAPADADYLTQLLPTMAARPRRRDVLPGAGRTRDGRRQAGAGRPGLRAGEHHRPGRRRSRPGGAGDTVHRPHPAPRRDRQQPDRRACRWVPPGVLDRRRADRRGNRDRRGPAHPDHAGPRRPAAARLRAAHRGRRSLIATRPPNAPTE